MNRFILASLPTPLHPLHRLGAQLGIDLWIKRDDLTGFAMGGNKVRKAEYLLYDALLQGADVLLTAGAVQSNHARVIAAAAACAGLECRLFLSGMAPEAPHGNLLLDKLAGAHVTFVANGDDRGPLMVAEAARLRTMGRRPYVIPIGGSNAVGAQGYFDAAIEMADQLGGEPALVVFASSSGGTYGGLMAGAADTSLDLLGIRVDLDPGSEEDAAHIASQAAGLRGLQHRFNPAEVRLDDRFVGPAYGLATREALEAMRLAWQLEGVLLDPVYTGKAMAGLMGLAAEGSLEGRRVVFLHTGGAPAVFCNSEVAAAVSRMELLQC